MSKYTAIDSTVPAQPQPNAGQIWQDNHEFRSNRFVLVLNYGKKSVACQSLKSGKITSVRRAQFNRGKTGFTYVADLSELGSRQLNPYLTQRFGAQLTMMAGTR